MSSVLDRSALEQSPLADLHVLANELGVDGFRRLRKEALIDAVLARQGGTAEPDADADGADAPEATDAAVETEEAIEAADAADEEESPKPRRGRRGGRGRGRARDADQGDADEGAPAEAVEEEQTETPEPAKPARGRSRARKPAKDDDGDAPADAPTAKDDDAAVEGVVELLANGTGFVRVNPPEESDDDVYVSAAQIKRCELVSGDKVSGPVRPPRRSERFPSLVRVDTINGRPADEVAEGTRYEDLAVQWPSERFELGSDDATLKAIEWLTPFGRGSRVTITGRARSGKTETLRLLADALARLDGLELSVVLAGSRPEEIADWSERGVTPAGALSFAASPDAQAAVVEQAAEHGRRVAARGGHAVLLVDGFEFLAPGAARRVLAAGRKLATGGSLTVIATAPVPVGGETTVVALDALATALGRFPALSLTESGTLRAELLVGDAGAEAIRAARADHLAPPV